MQYQTFGILLDSDFLLCLSTLIGLIWEQNYSTHGLLWLECDLNDQIGEGNDVARERAKQLETKLPLGTELVNFDCKIVN